MSRRDAFDCLTGLLSLDSSLELQHRLQHTLDSESLSWSDVVAIASDQWVSAAVWSGLRRKSLRNVEKDALGYFEAIATLNRWRNAKLRSQAVQLSRLLNGLGVVPIFLKGAANLLSDLYPDPAMRILVDLDVLVPSSRVFECVGAMLDAGYVQLGEDLGPAHHHYPSLGRADAEAAVELHVDPLDVQFKRFLSCADVAGSAVTMMIDDAQLAVPAAWCRLVHCVAHKQFADHAFGYGQLPLRDLLDSALLLRSENIDFEAIRTRFSSRERIALAFHLVAAERLLGANIAEQHMPPWVERVLFRRALFYVAHPRLAAWTKALLRPWFLLRRSLSYAALRKRLVRNLLDPSWYSRQLQMVRKSLRH